MNNAYTCTNTGTKPTSKMNFFKDSDALKKK